MMRPVRPTRPMLSSESSVECCTHEEEVGMLQEKLGEVHQKLIDQLELCHQQEMMILELTETVTGLEGRERAITGSFRQLNTPSEHYQPSEDNYESGTSANAKNQLLKADLQAMRKRVLTEITEKNKAIEMASSMRKAHKREVINLNKKFEGLQILYRRQKSQGPKQLQPHSPDKSQASKLEQANKRIKKLEMELATARQSQARCEQQNRRLRRQNEQLHKSIQINDNQQQQEYQLSTDKLRDLGMLREQIGELNKSIEMREQQFQQNSMERMRQKKSADLRKGSRTPLKTRSIF